MDDFVIKGGSVLTEDGMLDLDVRIIDGRITELSSAIDAPHTVDASDSWVGPGLVDLHTHLRDPGELWKEDIASGTRAAAAGGYTAVVAMPNTVPTVDNAQTALYVSARGRTAGFTDVIPGGAITLGRAGNELARIDEMWDTGVRVFTDDGTSVADSALLRRAMEYIEDLGGVVAQHALDAALSASGSMHEGTVSSRLGMAGIPAVAEEIVIARDLALVRTTGVKYHVQHVSSSRGVELIAAAKAEGLSITAEVTPHHLEFDHHDVEDTDSDFKMMPPLRTEDDRLALAAALRSGVIDVVATDHAPHAPREKDVPFEEAPSGVLGLEWAASVTRRVIGDDPARFFAVMAILPATIAQIPDHGLPIAVGNRANISVFAPQESWTPTRTLSRSRNAPYFDRNMKGRPVATIMNGRLTHGDFV